jgi:hypothetical protein
MKIFFDLFFPQRFRERVTRAVTAANKQRFPSDFIYGEEMQKNSRRHGLSYVRIYIVTLEKELRRKKHSKDGGGFSWRRRHKVWGIRKRSAKHLSPPFRRVLVPCAAACPNPRRMGSA